MVERVSALEQVTSVLAEALVTRYVYEDIARETPFRSERTLKKFRNARSDELNINLMIESDKSVYVVEVEVRPKYEDVGSLSSKLDIVRKHY